MIGTVIGAIVLICVIMIISGRVSLVMNGFAIDNDGNLYIGREREIVVLKDDICVRKIDPPTSRTYKFTIIDGQTIILSTSTKIYTMDLSGNILSERSDEGNKVYSQLQWKKTYVDQKGSNYTLKSNWGRKAIYKEEIQIYVMPIFDYIVLIMLITVVLTLIITLVCFLTQHRLTIKRRLRRENQGENQGTVL